jgi:hypothetical protein
MAAAIVAQTIVSVIRALGVAGVAEGVDTRMRLRHHGGIDLSTDRESVITKSIYRSFSGLFRQKL